MTNEDCRHGLSSSECRHCRVEREIDARESDEAAASDAADEHREFNNCWKAKEPTLTHVEKTLLYALK